MYHEWTFSKHRAERMYTWWKFNNTAIIFNIIYMTFNNTPIIWISPLCFHTNLVLVPEINIVSCYGIEYYRLITYADFLQHLHNY